MTFVLWDTRDSLGFVMLSLNSIGDECGLRAGIGVVKSSTGEILVMSRHVRTAFMAFRNAPNELFERRILRSNHPAKRVGNPEDSRHAS